MINLKMFWKYTYKIAKKKNPVKFTCELSMVAIKTNVSIIGS